VINQNINNLNGKPVKTFCHDEPQYKKNTHHQQIDAVSDFTVVVTIYDGV
jgi:hypothetical protein